MKTEINTQIIIKGMEKESAPLFKKLTAVSTVNSKADFAMVSANITALKAIGKAAKAKKASIVDPIKQGIKEIDSLFKPFIDRCDEMEANAKRLLLQYQIKLDTESAKLEADFASGKIKKASTVVGKQAELVIEDENVTIRKTWTAIATDASKTPREFMVPNEIAIKEALKAGKKVAGWEWKQVKGVSI